MCEIIKTYKYRLKLSKEQEETIDSYINTSRAVYNLALETKIYAYKSRKVSLSKFDLMKQLTDCKEEFKWMKEVPSQSLQDTIERMDNAYQSFFKGGGFPKFAKRDRYNSILFKQVKQVDNYIFKLPKLGTVTIFKDRQPKGELRNATITRVNNKYYMSVVTKQVRSVDIKNDDSQVGIDVGVSYFASLSDGTQIENPRHTIKYAKKLRVLSRSLNRKKKGSKSRDRARLRVSKMHEKLANTRRDFLHKQSTKLIQEFDTIVVEDLIVKNMIKFGYLSKHIADVSWSEFFNQLECKSNWNGNDFIKINPRFTSQKCSGCGAIDKKSRVSQSKFVCTSCGMVDNADINASNNILGEGIALIRQRGTLVRA